MSSTNRSTYTSASFNSQVRSYHEPADHLGPNSRHLSLAASESTRISSPNYSQTFSNSTSPSNLTNSTPGESLPEDNYQLSELGNTDDEFLGVNFDAGVHRVYSIPATLLDGADYHSPGIDQSLADLQPHLEDELSFQGLNKPAASHDEHSSEHHTLQFQPLTHPPQLEPATESSTPKTSGRSQKSAQCSDPSTMVGPHLSDPLVGPQWEDQQTPFGSSSFIQSDDHYEGAGPSDYFGPSFSVLSAGQAGQPSEAVGLQTDETRWESSGRIGPAGVGPEERKAIADKELPSLKEQEETQRLEEKNNTIEKWIPGARGDSEVKNEAPEEGQDIPPVDDAASIHENKLIEDQVYFSFKNTAQTEADSKLMQQSRHWFDPPSVPYITATEFQPATSDEAMRKWQANADTFSLASRVATWGTRRRSEPSLSEMDAILDGSFLKKLSISKQKEPERNRSNSIFRLASIVRNKKDSSRRKRSRSPENASSRHEAGSLGINKKAIPGLNTTPAVVGTAQKTVGSNTPARASPKSPTTHLGFARNIMSRARSRSELSHSDAAGLVDLWRGQGGPPVPSLTTPPLDVSAPQPRADGYDHDEEDDEDDEQADENDVEIKSEEQSEPIVPNYEGFKTHVRRLNPNMDLSDCSWLVSRIGRQQETRYKYLLELRVGHIRAAMAHSCPNRNLCKLRSPLLDVKGYTGQSERAMPDLQLVTEFSDDSISEGALTSEAFPPGVPMPPIRSLPAEFECQLCFKSKRFQKPSDWTKHVHEDLQPFTCTFSKCKEPKSFKRKADWVRHENERHRRLEWWKCEVNDCGHVCYRKDNFLQHLVREHKYTEPAQKTKAAIKKANSVDPAWEMLERCHHETASRPQSEPCKFCGKTFNTWKKLMVHHAKHMEQICLPVLRLVEMANVDGNTIISPIDQNPTPVTPNGGPKIEPHSPFLMDNIPLHASSIGPQFTSPSYIPPITSSALYGTSAQIPQDIDYNHTAMFMNSHDSRHISQAHNFDYLDPSSIGSLNPTNAYMSTGQNFSSGLSGQGFGTSQPTGYSIPTSYSSGAPSVSGYQIPYAIRVTDPTALYDLDVAVAPNVRTNLQPVSRSRSQGVAPTYGYSQQNVPNSGSYFGNPQ